jgi:hypothetical protein
LLETDYLAGSAAAGATAGESVTAGAASVAAGAASSAAGAAVSSVAAGVSSFGALLHDTKANVATVTKAKNTFFILLFVLKF